MSKLRHEALNYLQILQQSFNLPLSNPTITLSILFILFPLNLITILFQPQLLQSLNTTLAISLLSKAYIHRPSTILKLLSSLQRQWKQILVTAIMTELIAFSSSYLLLLLGYFATLFRFIMVVTGFSVYMFVHLGCQLSIVVSSTEDGYCGLPAIRRAIEIIRGRKVQAFVLMALMFVADAVVNACVPVADAVVNACVPVAAVLFQILWCSVYCVLYMESRKKQETEKDEEKGMI